MSIIKAYTGYNNKHNHYYYTNFEIVDELPKIGGVIDWSSERYEEVKFVTRMHIECNQPKGECYNYDYYKIITRVIETDCDNNKNVYEETYYYAVEIDKNAVLPIAEEFADYCQFKVGGVNQSQDDAQALVEEWFEPWMLYHHPNYPLYDDDVEYIKNRAIEFITID